MNRPYLRRFERELARAIDDHPEWPIVVSGGDSWFSYPLTRNVMDWLDDPRATGRAEDQTAWALFQLARNGEELVSVLSRAQKRVLRRVLGRYPVQALLWSGGGNDLVGPELEFLLRDYRPGMSAEECVQRDRVERRQEIVRTCYLEILDLASDAGRDVVVYAHGYDYMTPSPVGFSILGVAVTKSWIHPHLVERGIVEPELQRAVVRVLVDALNDAVAATTDPRFRYLDVRGTVGEGWHNEIHPDREGSRRVARVFADALVQRFPGLALPGL